MRSFTGRLCVKIIGVLASWDGVDGSAVREIVVLSRLKNDVTMVLVSPDFHVSIRPYYSRPAVEIDVERRSFMP